MSRARTGLRVVVCALIVGASATSGGSARATAAGSITIGGASAVPEIASATPGTRLTFDVTLSGPSANPVTVHWSVFRDTAVPTQNRTTKCSNGDYVSDAGGLVTFPAGTVERRVAKVLCGSMHPPTGSVRQFHVILNPGSATGGYDLGSHSEDLGTIIQPPCFFCAPAVSIGDSSIGAGISGRRALDFTVTLTRPSSSAVSVDYTVNSVSASCGPTKMGKPVNALTDCDNLNGTRTLTFPLRSNGQTTYQKTIHIPIFQDSTNTGDETFTVGLSNARDTSGPVAIDKGTGIGTVIKDN
jgi:hypothetical protein